MENKEKQVLVSISCITYNHAPYIRECLDGFMMQKCDFGFEVLIHDDASTDGTQEIIKEFQEKYPNIIKPILQTENQYSKGIRFIGTKFNVSRAQGKYIAMCEGDDYWTDPLKLQKQVDFMEKNQNYVLCFHLINYLNDDTGEIEKTYPTGLIKSSFSQEDIAVGNFIPTPSILFRRPKEDFPSYTGIAIGDYPLYLFLSSKGPTKFLDFIGATYRYGVGTFSTLEKRNQQVAAKKMLDAVLGKDFLSEKSRKSLKKQKLYYGKSIFKSDNQPDKFNRLFLAKDEYVNYTFQERLQIILKSLFQK